MFLETENSTHTCAHCGLTCDSSICRIDDTNGNEYFCCIGCRAVKNVITHSGLSEYYKVRDALQQPGMTPQEEFDHTGVYLDDPLYVEKFTSPMINNSRLVRFYLPEVYCGACVWLLERMNVCEPGIVSSQLSLVNKQLEVIYNPQKIPLSSVARLVKNFGYTFHILDKSQKINYAYKNEDLSRLAVAVFCAMNCMMIAVSLYQGWWTGIDSSMKFFLEIVSAILALPTITYSAQPIILKALAGLRVHKLTLDFPLAFGIISGYLLSLCSTLFGLGEVYYDSLTVLIALLLTARYANRFTLERFRRKGDMLTSIFPQYALRVDPRDSDEVEVFIDRVGPDDVCVVKPRMIIPADGEVLDGTIYVDSSIMSGEVEPIKVVKGGSVWAGTRVVEGRALLKLSSSQTNSRFYQNISSFLSRAELGSDLSRKIDNRSNYFIIWILSISVLAFTYHYINYDFKAAYEVLLSVLVISCPCALGISVPFSFTSACMKAASKGIFFSNGGAIERLAAAKKIAFDKTGTLTKGTFSYIEGKFLTETIRTDEVLAKIYAVELSVAHPVAKAILQYVSNTVEKIEKYKIVERLDKPGAWVGGVFEDGSTMMVGSRALLETQNINVEHLNLEFNKTSTVVYALYNDKVVCAMKLSDLMREGMPSLISFLHKKNIQTYLLSGDRKEVVLDVARNCGISLDNSFFQLSPEQKSEIINNLGSNVVMVGDGINDIHALQSASLGISVTGGLELLQKAGGVSIFDFSADKFYQAYNGALSTVRAGHLSILFSIVYNLITTLSAAVGFISPLIAAVLMPISSLMVVLIAARVPNFNSRL